MQMRLYKQFFILCHHFEKQYLDLFGLLLIVSVTESAVSFHTNLTPFNAHLYLYDRAVVADSIYANKSPL